MNSRFLVLVVLVLGACGGPPSATMPREPGRADAPYELENNDDLAESRQRFEIMDKGPKRDKARNRIAIEYTRRIRSHLRKRQRNSAFASFGNLVTLWNADELRSGSHTLRVYAKEFQSLRKEFSRSGGVEEAIATLEALSLAQPENAIEHQKEIDEILAYSDELGIAKDGSGAKRARPILVLEKVLPLLATDNIVNRLVSLYQSRQRAIQSAFRRQGADYALLRIHGTGALNTTHNIVAFLVQAGRTKEAIQAIEAITGIGDDNTLRTILTNISAQKSATPWLELAAKYRETDLDKHTAFLLCQSATVKFPGDAKAAFAAGNTALGLQMPLWAIQYYEKGLKLAPRDAPANRALAELYEQQVSRFAFAGRPNAALTELHRFEKFYAQASTILDKPLSPDLSSAYSAMARGLVSLGELQSAREYLKRSLRLGPNQSTLEYLGTLSLRQNKFKLAAQYYQKAIDLETDSFSDKFNKLRLQRLLSETKAAAGKYSQASKIRTDLLLKWARLIKEYDLGRATSATALIEIGKLEFARGQLEAASSFFFQALSMAGDSKGNHADLVAFLITRGSYEIALDVYLDALGNRAVTTYYKTYMSLWILAESYRLDIEAESHSLDFLREQRGGLWSAKLAQFAATGKGRKTLESMATTRGRRAELLYYSAVIGPERDTPSRVQTLLKEVVRGSMVLFFEYEMAKVRLGQSASGLPEPGQAGSAHSTSN